MVPGGYTQFPTGQEAGAWDRVLAGPGPMVRTRRVDAIDREGHVVATSLPLGQWDAAIEFPPFARAATVTAVVPVVGEYAVGPAFKVGPTAVLPGQDYRVSW